MEGQTPASIAPSPSSTLEFLHIVGRLKRVPRTGWVRSGVQHYEHVADHMYRMSLIAMLLDDQHSSPIPLDRTRCIKMALVHDLAESLVGDITPHDPITKEEKSRMEGEAMDTICSHLGPSLSVADEIKQLWQEYEDASTAEAQFIKEVDKFEMILQAFEYEGEQPTLDLQQFYDGTRGKFKHPLMLQLVSELEQKRERLLSSRNTSAQQSGAQPSPLPSLLAVESWEPEASTLTLFEKYCGITDVQVIRARVAKIRESAIASCHSYRCIKELMFCLPRMMSTSIYPHIASALISDKSKRLLDIGCCMGADLRTLVNEGVGSQQLFGLDLFPEFLALGFELFSDADSPLARNMTTGDLLSDEFAILDKGCAQIDASPALCALEWKQSMDFVYAGSVLHLLDQAGVCTMVRRCIGFLKPGGIYFGRTVGQLVEAGEWTMSDSNKPKMASKGAAILRYLHTPDTLKRVLEEAGLENVQVEVVYPREQSSGDDEKRPILNFSGSLSLI